MTHANYIKLKLCVCVLSCLQLFVTPWTVARQAPLSMEFSRQEFWSELPFPPPGDLPEIILDVGSLIGIALNLKIALGSIGLFFF